MDNLLILLGIGFVLWCIGEGIVRIIRASRGGASNSKVAALQSQLDDMEQELDDARKRIEVLEAIVTDDGHQLRKEIDGLTADG